MKDTVVAYRYAKALLEAARAAKEETLVRENLDRFAQLMRLEPDLSAALQHPLVSVSDKKKQVEKLIRETAASMGHKTDVDMSKTFSHFLGLLLEKKRLSLLPFIASLFESALDEVEGIRRVQVKSAAPLSDKEAADIQKRLEKKWNCRVVVEHSVDKNLIGGLVMRWGDTVWDYSVTRHLERLRHTLMNAAV